MLNQESKATSLIEEGGLVPHLLPKAFTVSHLDRLPAFGLLRLLQHRPAGGEVGWIWRRGGRVEAIRRSGRNTKTEQDYLRGGRRRWGLTNPNIKHSRPHLLVGAPKEKLLEIYALAAFEEGVAGCGPDRLKAARLVRRA